MKIPEKIKEDIRHTVGYAEAENKTSFIVGSQVAFAKAEDFYIPEINRLENQLNHYKIMYECTNNDMETVAKIISKYQDKDL